MRSLVIGKRIDSRTNGFHIVTPVALAQKKLVRKICSHALAHRLNIALSKVLALLLRGSRGRDYVSQCQKACEFVGVRHRPSVKSKMNHFFVVLRALRDDIVESKSHPCCIISFDKNAYEIPSTLLAEQICHRTAVDGRRCSRVNKID